MKKKGLLIGVIALVLICGITYAAYVQQSVAKGTSIVAKWRFKANGEKSNFNIDLTKSASKLYNGKIGPGSSGSFDIDLDGTGSQVDIDYVISFSNLENVPKNMIFYADANKTKNVNLDSYKINGTITYGANMKKKYTIYWNWPTNGSGDNSDAGKTMVFDVIVDAVQKTN